MPLNVFHLLQRQRFRNHFHPIHSEKNIKYQLLEKVQFQFQSDIQHRYAACCSHINVFHHLSRVMIQAHTWQRQAVGRALRHETQQFVPIQVRRSRNRQLNEVKAVIHAKLQYSLLDKYFHLSPLGCLAALHTWRRLVTKVGTSKNLLRLQCVISIFFSDWAFLHPELP